MMAIAMLMGVLAALGWGTTDYLAGSTAKLTGIRRTALFTQSAGWIAVGLLLLVAPSLQEKAKSATLTGWGYGLSAVAFNLAGSMSLLRAFSVGRASLIAPLITSYAAVTAVLGLAFNGDQLSGFRLLGVLICLFGAPMAAIRPGGQGAKSGEGVGYALLTALCFGFGFWVQGHFAVPAIGVTPMLWLFFSVGILIMASILAFRGEPLWPQREAIPLLLFQSLSNLIGYATFAVGVTTGAVTVVTVLSTFAAAVTALFGFFFRNERLSRKQMVGVFLIISGASLLAL